MNDNVFRLMIPDRKSISQATNVGTCVKRLWHCRGRGMSISRCICSEANVPFVRWYQEVEYERALLDLISLPSECDAPEVSLSSVMLRRLLLQFYNVDSIDYCRWYCAFEFRLWLSFRPVMVRWRYVEISASYPASRP